MTAKFNTVNVMIEPGVSELDIKDVQMFEHALDEFLAQYALQRNISRKAGLYVSWQYSSQHNE